MGLYYSWIYFLTSCFYFLSVPSSTRQPQCCTAPAWSKHGLKAFIDVFNTLLISQLNGIIRKERRWTSRTCAAPHHCIMPARRYAVDCVHACVYVSVWVHACACACVCARVCNCVPVCMCMCLCLLFVYAHDCACMYVHARVYACLCVRVCVRDCVCVYSCLL